MTATNGAPGTAAHRPSRVIARAARLAPRYAVAANVALFTIQDDSLKVLLVKRAAPPFGGTWGLPGGFVRRDESVDEAALRELQEATGITTVYLEQLYTFGDLDRDPRAPPAFLRKQEGGAGTQSPKSLRDFWGPRGRVVAVAYYAVVGWIQFQLKAARNRRLTAAKWCELARLPVLAFDHRKIIAAALERLRNKVNYTSVAFQLLPKKFALSELQRAYEVILDQALDKRNFRKKMLQLGILRNTGEHTTEGRQRPARLYSFTETRVIKFQEKGIIVPF